MNMQRLPDPNEIQRILELDPAPRRRRLLRRIAAGAVILAAHCRRGHLVPAIGGNRGGHDLSDGGGRTRSH